MEFIPAKTIVTTNQSQSWFGTRYNMNLYRGCPHGCIYCDSRSDCYRDTTFDQVKVKENALTLVREDLRRKVQKGVIGTGSMSDPYNPWEKKLELTRHALELVSAYGFGIAVATKSDLVVRDKDILAEIKEHSPVLVKITITTPYDQVSQKIEPHVASSSQRFAALEELAKEGIYSGVLLMPVLPWITDNPEDIRLLLRQAADSGARFVYASFGVTVRDGQREYFYQQLDRQYPGLSQRYHTTYGSRYSCSTPQARELFQMVAEECNRLGLLYQMPEITRQYKQGYEGEQLSFF